MPRKIPGYHGIHAHVREDQWLALQVWCSSGVATIPAKLIINTLLDQFCQVHIQQNKSTDLESVSRSVAEAVANSIPILQRARGDNA